MSKHKRPKIRTRKQSNKATTLSGSIPRPETNVRASISVVPSYPANDPRSQPPPRIEGYSGTYTATFVLSVPGKDVFLASLNTDQLMRSGNSQLEVDRNVKEFLIEATHENKQYFVRFERNTDALLSAAQVKIDALNFKEAERLAFDIVSPILSHWSFRYNIALDVSTYEILEEKTGTKRWSFALLGKPKLFSPQIGAQAEFSQQLRPILATYREAMNATNVFHTVLCFYKAIRATQLLTQRRFQNSNTPETEKTPPERFPEKIEDVLLDTRDHTALFEPFLGKKFNWVMDQYQTLLRNTYAHLDPEKNDLCADNFDDVTACIRAIPILRYIARQLLQAEIAAQSC